MFSSCRLNLWMKTCIDFKCVTKGFSSNRFASVLNRQYSSNRHKKLSIDRWKAKPGSFCDSNSLSSRCSKENICSSDNEIFKRDNGGGNCDKEKLLDCISATGRELWDNNKNIKWHYPSDTKTDKLFERVTTPVNRNNKRRRALMHETMNQPLTVCVEGNIGSGKTTFLKHFKKFPNIGVLDEPISKWRDCQGYNLLDLMYKDPRKWSLCFQSYVQLTMLDLHTKPIVQPIKMMERSIYSAQYCFVQNLRDEGLMDDAQFSVLSEWFDFSMENLPVKVDLIVYLRTDPEVAYGRVGQRGRSEENSIKLEYLQRVHKHHEDWLIRNEKLLPCPVLTIDANTALADMTQNYQLCEERMFQKVAVANC